MINSWAFATVRLKIKAVEDPNEIWTTLKKQYEASDLTTEQPCVSDYSSNQSDFKTIVSWLKKEKPNVQWWEILLQACKAPFLG